MNLPELKTQYKWCEKQLLSYQFYPSVLFISFTHQFYSSVLPINFICQFFPSVLSVSFIYQFYLSVLSCYQCVMYQRWLSVHHLQKLLATYLHLLLWLFYVDIWSFVQWIFCLEIAAIVLCRHLLFYSRAVYLIRDCWSLETSGSCLSSSGQFVAGLKSLIFCGLCFHPGKDFVGSSLDILLLDF